MKMEVLRRLGFSLAAISLLGLSGCASTTSQPKSRVDYGDTNERDLIRVGVTMTDLKELASTVTQKFLRSPQVQGWDTKPRLVLGRLVNNTDDESIQMSDLSDLVTNLILGSGLVRLLDVTADDFDYILKQSLTSKRQYGTDDNQVLHFTMQMKLYSLDGELVGQWSHDIKQVQAGRSNF
ncbi:MAG: hypothetical protein JRG96_01275 [Deltaproteobacteria bacterium]|nr:hypothetical protein [Deltaproteobacteria bacterium]MBW2420330.1 hypothetical protein [Deltaproteobacteria bacterium]